MRHFITIVFLVISFSALSTTPNELGNMNAPKKGVYNYHLGSFPPTINPFTYTDVYASYIHSYTLESLCDRNIETYGWQPRLAESWEEAKDGKSIVFNLRSGIKWHDGKPLTAEDVKFSFDAIMDKDNKYKTARLRPYYENISSVEILSKNKVKFNIKNVYFGNFSTAAGMSILPKHIYEDTSKKNLKKLNKTIVGTGALHVEEV